MILSELIAGSMRLIGAKASGEALTGLEGADGLAVVNDILEQWNLERLMAPGGLEKLTLTTTPGLQPHTIGAGGTFNIDRPVSVDSAFYVVGGTEIPIEVVDQEGWAAIDTKGLTGANPQKLWYDDAYPLGKVNLWPYPNAAYGLVLWVWNQIGPFASTAAIIAMPPAYRKALRYALALELAPEYGRSVPEAVVMIARETKAAIKSKNISTPVLSVDPALSYPTRGNGLGDFLAG